MPAASGPGRNLKPTPASRSIFARGVSRSGRPASITWPGLRRAWRTRRAALADDRPDGTGERPAFASRNTTSSSSPTPACSPRPGRWPAGRAGQAYGGTKTRIFDQTPVRRIDLDGPPRGCDRLLADRRRPPHRLGRRLGQAAPARVAVPLRATRQQVLYFRPRDPSSFQIGRFPIFIYVPERSKTPTTACPSSWVWASRSRATPVPKPTPTSRIGPSARSTVHRPRLPARPHSALADAPIDLTETCLYTVAPDEQFQVDFLPGRADVIVASPCSGHGFKFSCLIGRILADLAVAGTTGLAIEPWRFREPPAPPPAP